MLHTLLSELLRYVDTFESQGNVFSDATPWHQQRRLKNHGDGATPGIRLGFDLYSTLVGGNQIGNYS